ncbi:MAG: hypothetical protein KatS3mg076_1997 [Candidatus Binatia bacterium]|nr:MAG: hypothetical protein KatS3mg076_1997 [Candidatus Binatia bacterium]
MNGDGLPALETQLYLPQDVTVAPDGTVYFPDWNNHRIRRIVDGIVETVTGTGKLGEARDGPALEVDYNHPTNVAFDHEGRMVIAAWHNSLVKRLDFSTGWVENLAGTGARAFGGDGGPGNQALLDLPSSVAVDSKGNILISDQANFRIRLLEPSGIIRTVCGVGTQGYSGDGGPAALAELNSPVGQAAPPAGRIAIDGRDRVYIADTGNHVIRMVDENGIITTIAGTGEPGYSGDGGPATEARLHTPSDVAVAPDGTVYVADTMNHVVRRISPDGVITTVAGTGKRGFGGDGGPAEEALLDRPYGIGIAPDGSVYVADTHNHRIRHLTAEPPEGPAPTPTPPSVEVVPCTNEIGTICTYAGTGEEGFNGDGRHRLETMLYWPVDIEFTPSGRIYVLDWNNHRVREIQPDGTLRTVVGTDFVGDGPPDLSDLTEPGAPGTTVDLNHPTDVLELPDGRLVLMAWHNHKIRLYDPETGRVRVLVGAEAGFRGDGGPARDALLNQPPHASFDARGNLFVLDQRNERIRVIRHFASLLGEGTIETVAGTGEAGFNGDGPALETLFHFPTGPNPEPSGGIAVGPDGAVYFADTLNHRIRKLVFSDADFRDGRVVTVAGTGEPGFSGDGGPAIEARLRFPQDLEFGPDGKLYFADAENHRIRRIDLDTGTIETVAGTGEPGFSGDGGPATAARLDRPFGVAFDAAGDLYIADTYNGRVRKVKLSETRTEPEPVFPEDYRSTFVEVRDCRFSIEHGGVSVRVLANPIAVQAYLNETSPLPVGSVVVKEEFAGPDCTDENLVGWRAMRKEAPGFDPEDNDWHWQWLDAERRIRTEDKTPCVACHRAQDCLERDYMCTKEEPFDTNRVRVVLDGLGAALLSVSGFTPEAPDEGGGAHETNPQLPPTQVWAVGADPQDGQGPLVLHYDGKIWHRLSTGAEGDLWWISVAPIDGAFYMTGTDGLVLRYDLTSRTFTREATPRGPTLFGIWGTDGANLWAVGGDPANAQEGGVIWHYDGSSWSDATPHRIPTLFKVWGRGETDVWAVGGFGTVLHFDGTAWNPVDAGLTRPLFTVHGNQDTVVATGGFLDGVILEFDGRTFLDRAPPGTLQMNGVFLRPDGAGVAAGIEGALARRTAQGWVLEEPGRITTWDFHAAWMDDRGGVWAVGGDLSTDLSYGILAYGGGEDVHSEIAGAGLRTGDARYRGERELRGRHRPAARAERVHPRRLSQRRLPCLRVRLDLVRDSFLPRARSPLARRLPDRARRARAQLSPRKARSCPPPRRPHAQRISAPFGVGDRARAHLDSRRRATELNRRRWRSTPRDGAWRI